MFVLKNDYFLISSESYWLKLQSHRGRYGYGSSGIARRKKAYTGKKNYEDGRLDGRRSSSLTVSPGAIRRDRDVVTVRTR